MESIVDINVPTDYQLSCDTTPIIIAKALYTSANLLLKPRELIAMIAVTAKQSFTLLRPSGFLVQPFATKELANARIIRLLLR